MNNNKWMAIVNPEAGSRKVSKDWPKISALLSLKGIVFDSCFTNHKYHAIELVIQAIKQGYRNFISVGGDGTTHEVVNGIFFQKEVDTSEMTLAVIPAGSGNDWVRMYDISNDYEKAVEAISVGKTTRQDIGKITVMESKVPQTRYMANISGIGFDAMVCYYCNKSKENGHNGKMVYVESAIKALGHKSKHYRVVVDGKTFFEGDVFSISFGNGRYSGGGMIQTPDSVVNDGLVNITVIKKISNVKVLANLGKLFTGEIYKIKEVIHTMGKTFRVECVIDNKAEIDGEVIGTTPYTMEVLPSALKVIVGANFSLDPQI